LNQCQETKNAKAESDNIRYWSDSTQLILDQQYAKNAVLETATKKSFLEIKNLTGEKKKLQDLVRNERNVSSALRSKITAMVHGQTDDVVISISDTLSEMYIVDESDSTRTMVLPTYRGTVKDSTWYSADIIAKPNNISMVLELEASFSYTWKYKRTKGFFGVKKPIVEASVDNPYINFTQLESWNEKQKPPRWSWGATAGIGISANLKPIVGVVVGPSFRLRDW